MFRYFLSLRYLLSRPTNWIGVAGIFVAVAALILILSIMTGFLTQHREFLRGNLSDLVVQPFFDRDIEPGVRPDRDPQRAIDLIAEDEAVSGVSPQLVWYGMIIPTAKEVGLTDPSARSLVLVSYYGVDIPAEYGVSDLEEHLVRDDDNPFGPRDIDDPFALPANYRPDGRPGTPVILGVQLANSWGLIPGDEVQLTTGSTDPETGQFREAINRVVVVVGTHRSQNNGQDLERIYMRRDDMADWLGRPQGYSQIAVKLHDYEGEAETFRSRAWTRLYGEGYLHAPGRYGWEMATWEDNRSSMLAAIENERVLLGVMLLLVLVVAAFTIFAILSMMVAEKRRDIGILCALGATPGGILKMFLMIGAWEALLGASLGCVAGILGARYINDIESALSRLFGVQIFNRDVYLFDHIPTVIEVIPVAIIVLGAVFLTLIAAAIPAIRAARLHPVDALRHE